MLGGKLGAMKEGRSLVNVKVKWEVKSWQGRGTRGQDNPRLCGQSTEDGLGGNSCTVGLARADGTGLEYLTVDAYGPL